MFLPCPIGRVGATRLALCLSPFPFAVTRLPQKVHNDIRHISISICICICICICNFICLLFLLLSPLTRLPQTVHNEIRHIRQSRSPVFISVFSSVFVFVFIVVLVTFSFCCRPQKEHNNICMSYHQHCHCLYSSE